MKAIVSAKAAAWLKNLTAKDDTLPKGGLPITNSSVPVYLKKSCFWILLLPGSKSIAVVLSGKKGRKAPAPAEGSKTEEYLEKSIS
jgi:hypothetical protein